MNDARPDAHPQTCTKTTTSCIVPANATELVPSSLAGVSETAVPVPMPVPIKLPELPAALVSEILDYAYSYNERTRRNPAKERLVREARQQKRAAATQES